MSNLKDVLAETKKNRRHRKNAEGFQFIQTDKLYPALIVDAWYDSENKKIKIEFVIFNSPKGTRRTVEFRADSAAVYHYQDICDTIGTEGNPKELIGESVFLHFEKNGDFRNVKVDEAISEEELQEALSEMDEDDEDTNSDNLEVVDELEDFN